MAIKIQGSTIIDDSRVLVNTGNIGIGTTNPDTAVDSGNTNILHTGIVTTNTIYGGTLNISGTSTFGNNIDLGDNNILRFGDSDDLQIYHDGSNSFIADTGEGDLVISATHLRLRSADAETYLLATANGSVELYYNGTEKFETTADGILVNPNVGLGTTAGNADASQDLAVFRTSVSNASRLRIVESRDVDGINWESAYTRIQKTIDTTDQAYIQFNGDGNTYGMEFGSATDNELFAKFVRNGAVELYYNGTEKFETTDTGINITGLTQTDTINVSGESTFTGDVSFGSTATFGDNDRLKFGDGEDLQIFHNGSNSYIEHTGTGALILKADTYSFRNGLDSEQLARFTNNGSVELYNDNFIKFATTGIGVSISNGAASTATIAGPSNLIIDPGTVGDNTGIVRIKGDLFVDGTTTQINSTVIELADFIVGVATTATTNLLTDGAGIGIGTDKTFLYEHNSGTNPSLKSSENLNVASGKGYQINQTEVLNASTLGSGVTISSLTSVGTLSELTVSGDVIASSTLTVGNANVITGGAPADQGVLSVYGTGKNMLILQTENNESSRGLAFRNAGDAYTGYISMENRGNNTADMVFGVDDSNETSIDNVTERLRITKEGQVGIGLTNPQDALTIRTSDDVTSIRIVDPSASTYGAHFSFIDGESEVRIGGIVNTTKRAAIKIDRDTVDNSLCITSNGNIGISKTNPGSKIHVDGTSTTAKIHIDSTSNGAQTFYGDGAGLLLTARGMNTNSKFTPSIQFGSTDQQFTTTNPKVGAAINAIASQTYNIDTAGGMHLAFYTTPSNPGTGQTTTERLRIRQDGNIGIGTDDPQYKLQVEGDIKLADTGTIWFDDTANTIEKITASGSTIDLYADSEVRFFESDTSTEKVSIDVNDGRIIFNNDHDTYWHRPAADTFAWITAGSERVRIASDGSVGINTDGPAYRLDVFDQDGAVLRSGSDQFRVNQTHTDWTNTTYAENPIIMWDYKSGPDDHLFFASGGNTAVGDQMAMVISEAHGFKVGKNGYDGTDSDVDPDNEFFRITNDGSVGIGNTDPSTKLDVAGDISIRNGDQLNAIRTNSAGQLQFLRNAASNNQVTVTIDDENGNVGINSTSPTQKLDVDGTIKAGNIVGRGTTNNNTVFSHVTNTQDPSLSFWGADHTSYKGHVHLIARSSNAASDSGQIRFYDYTGSGWNLNMVIDKNGNVGINKSIPTAKLDVDGTINVSGNATLEGDVILDTDTNTKFLYISRLGGTDNQFTKIGRDDTITHFHTKNDESSSTVRFRFENTDTEGGGGANANDRNIDLISDATNGARITIDGNRVLTTADEGSGNGIDADTLDSQEGSFYQNASNINAGTLSNDRLHKPVSGSWWQGVGVIGSDGVMEVGRYIDFHSTNTTTADYHARLDCSANGVLQLNGYRILTEAHKQLGGYRDFDTIVDFGSAAAGTEKRIIKATLVNTTYSTVGFTITVIDNKANHATSGSVNETETSTYIVNMVRTTDTTLNNPNAVYIRGPKGGDLIRARRVSTGVYEVTIKNSAQWRDYRIIVRPHTGAGAHTINYYNGDTPSTAQASYTSSVSKNNIVKNQGVEFIQGYGKGVLEFSSTLESYDPAGGDGSDTSTDAAIALPSGKSIVGYDNGYIRNLLKWTNGGDIEIGQGGTGLIDGINLLPGSGGIAKVNGNEILHVGLQTATSRGMKTFYQDLVTVDDWVASPISIRERALVGTGTDVSRYAPNLNFHWSGRVSSSFWMDKNGHMNYGSYDASGTPSANGVLRLSRFEASEYRARGTQLVLNAGEAAGKFSGQTEEKIYANSEAGLIVSTPDRNHQNFEENYTQESTHINGRSIGINVAPGGNLAGSPACLAIGDSDTGLAQNGDGILQLWSNNTEVAQVTGAGVTSGIHLKSGWFRASGDNGLYFHNHGGGWYMEDSTWIRTYGSKSIYQNSGVLRTDGTLRVGSDANGTFNAPNNGTPTIDGHQIYHAGGVMKTAPGGNSDSNYWAKLATYSSGTTQYQDCTVILAITNEESSVHGTAIISVFFRQNNTNADPTVGVEIISMSGTGAFHDDGFKIVSGGWNTNMELWMKKKGTYGHFRVNELSKHLEGTLTYNDGATWQASEPTGSVRNVKSDGASVRGNKIFHDGYHPNADTLTTARTISLGGHASGSASFNGGSNVTISAAINKTADQMQNDTGNWHTFVNDGGGNIGQRWNSTVWTNSFGGSGHKLVEAGWAWELEIENDSGNGGELNLRSSGASEGTANSLITWSTPVTVYPGGGVKLQSSYTGNSDYNLYIRQLSNASGATIRFSDQGSEEQFGLFTYKHADDDSNSAANSFHFNSSETSTAVIIDQTSGNSGFYVGTNKCLTSAGGELNGQLIIDSDNHETGALRIESDITNSSLNNYYAQEMDVNLSGSQTFTDANRHQGGIHIDLDSSSTGGGTGNNQEHRVYGINCDVDVSGDSDAVYAVLGNATVTPGAGTVSTVYGGYFQAEDNGGSGSVTNVIAVRGQAVSDNAASDIDNMYAGYFKATCMPDTGNIGEVNGVYAVVEIPDNTGDHYGDTYVIRAKYDDNDAVEQTNTTYLFHGDYDGTLPSTAYGVYIENDIDNYFRGKVITLNSFEVKHSTDDDVYMQLYCESQTTNIADTFSDTTTDKKYIFFSNPNSSNDPGYIMHETSNQSSNPDERNEGVLHLVPSDDNNDTDYVSIHGTNDPDSLKLTTTGRIETAANYRLTLKSGDGSVYINDDIESSGNYTISNGAPTIKLNSTDSGEDDFWIHANSNNFYVLVDRDADGDWDDPHALQLEGDTNIGYLFGNRIWHEGNTPHNFGNTQGGSTYQTNVDLTSSDFNSVCASVFYPAGGSNVTGDPTSSHTGQGYLFTMGVGDNDNRSAQILASSGGDQQFYFRTKNDSGYQDWRRVWHSGTKIIYTGSDDEAIRLSSATHSGASLYIGGWNSASNDNIHRIRNSSNLHIDSAADGDLLLQWYSNRETKFNGDVRFQDDRELKFGTNADFRIEFNGTNTIFRNYAHTDGDIYFQGETTGGVNQTIMRLDCSTASTYALINHAGNERFRTQSGGVKITGELTVGGDYVSGGEGGHINLTHSPNTTLGGSNLVLDLQTNTFRIFTDGGNNKGAYLNVASCGDSVGSQIFHDGYHPNANTLTNARTISLGGHASGSVSFNGGSNVTISTTINKTADQMQNHTGNWHTFVNDGGGNIGQRWNSTTGGTNNLVQNGIAYELEIEKDGANGDYTIHRGKGVNNTAGGQITWTKAFKIEGNDGTVKLYHNDAEKFYTTSTGVYVNGRINFPAQATDAALIRTTISGTTTHLDFYLSDDNNADTFRWRFNPSGGTEYTALELKPYSNTESELRLSGVLYLNNKSIVASYDSSGLGGGNIDHFWHSDTGLGGTGGVWNFCSDTTHRNVGNSAIRMGKKLMLGTGLSGIATTRNAFIALGDSDTGLSQNGDGILELVANNVMTLQIRSSGTENGAKLNNGWFRAPGNNGLYFTSWGGGWRMQDSTWIRTYGNKSIYHNTGALRTDGTLQVGNNGSKLNVPSNGTPTIDGNTIWHAGNDGSGSGLYADNSQNVRVLFSNNTANVPVMGANVVWDANNADYTSRMTQGDGKFNFNRSNGTVNIGGNLKAQGVYDSTNGSNALVRVKSDGQLRRDSSSRRYKRNIEDAQYSYAENFIDNARPVWFQALIPDPEYPQQYLDSLEEGQEPDLEDCFAFVKFYNFNNENSIEWNYYEKSSNEGTNPDHGWWGFIAEELAEVDPRLVVFDDNDGSAIAINYDRSIPHIVNELKRKRQEVRDLQDLVNNLVSRVEALESANT